MGSCCCKHGAAVRGEFPEFPCRKCPRHAMGDVTGRLCRRHKKEALGRVDTRPAFEEPKVCAYCKVVLLLRAEITHPHKSTIDHVIPRSRGGTNMLWNRVPCCYRCNQDKADKTPAEWVDRWYMQPVAV